MHDIDPELKYCPICGDEYRADIQRCAACDVELITGAEKLSQKGEKSFRKKVTSITENDELAAIQRGQMRDMKNLQAILKEQGVASLISKEGADCSQGCCGPEVLLLVRQQELDEALTLLASEFQRSTSLASYDLSGVDAIFDTNAQEVTCPACGFNFVPTTSECPDCGLVMS